RRIAGDAELRPLPLDDAEEARIVEVARRHQFVEPIGAEGRPLAVNGDDDRALRRFEPHAIVARRGAARHASEEPDRDQYAGNDAHAGSNSTLAAIALFVHRP